MRTILEVLLAVLAQVVMQSLLAPRIANVQGANGASGRRFTPRRTVRGPTDRRENLSLTGVAPRRRAARGGGTTRRGSRT